MRSSDQLHLVTDPGIADRAYALIRACGYEVVAQRHLEAVSAFMVKCAAERELREQRRLG